MENKSAVSKFVSRQTARMMANTKKVRIFLVIGAVLGIVSMFFALSAVDKRVNPRNVSPSPSVGSHISPAPEAEIIVEGDFTFSLENRILTLVSYNGSSSVVEIPMFIEGCAVRYIGDNAFKGNRSIASVTIPNSVCSIGSNAFSGCSNLIDVTMPLSLNTIGSAAFANCKMLKAIIIPSNFTEGSSNAFRGCAKDFTLYVFSGSTGESYAKNNGYAYDYAAEELIG